MKDPTILCFSVKTRICENPFTSCRPKCSSSSRISLIINDDDDDDDDDNDGDDDDDDDALFLQSGWQMTGVKPYFQIANIWALNILRFAKCWKRS